MNGEKPRYENGVYTDCKWCKGRGCLYCKAEADKEYKRQFPDGPKPLLSISTADLDSAAISEATGGPGVEAAYGPLGKLMDDIREQLSQKSKTI